MYVCRASTISPLSYLSVSLSSALNRSIVRLFSACQQLSSASLADVSFVIIELTSSSSLDSSLSSHSPALATTYIYTITTFTGQLAEYLSKYRQQVSVRFYDLCWKYIAYYWYELYLGAVRHAMYVMSIYSTLLVVFSWCWVQWRHWAVVMRTAVTSSLRRHHDNWRRTGRYNTWVHCSACVDCIMYQHV